MEEVYKFNYTKRGRLIAILKVLRNTSYENVYVIEAFRKDGQRSRRQIKSLWQGDWGSRDAAIMRIHDYVRSRL